MQLKNKLKECWPYIGVVLAIILPWFFHSGYLFFTDMSWGPIIALDWTSGWFLLNVIIKILSFVVPVALIEKLFIGCALLTILLGGRKVAGYFIKDKFAIFVCSLFALFNPFVYDRLMYGQLGIVLAFGLFLLAAGYFLEYLNSRVGRSLIYSGIWAGLAVQFSAQFIFFIGIVLVIFLVLYFKKWGLSEGRRGVKYILITGVICVLLNANWIAGNIFRKTGTLNFVESGITRQDLLAFKTSGTSDGQVVSNVVLMSGFWGKDQHRYADLTAVENNWGRSFIFLLPIIIVGFIAGIRKKVTRFMVVGLTALWLVGVILASGVAWSFAAPLPYWLFDHFPLYKGLRESQKWVAVIVLVYATFLAMGLVALFKAKFVVVNRRVLLIALAIIIVMQAPLLLWGLGGQVKSTSYPVDWYTANKLMAPGGQCDGNVLFLPWHAYMSFSWVGRIVANPAKSFFSCSVVSGTNMEWGGIYDNSGDVVGQEVMAWLSAGGQSELLRDKNIKYIVVAKELDWQNYSGLAQNNQLKLISNSATLLIYKVKD